MSQRVASVGLSGWNAGTGLVERAVRLVEAFHSRKVLKSSPRARQIFRMSNVEPARGGTAQDVREEAHKKTLVGLD